MYESSLNDLGYPSWIAQDPDRKFVLDEITDETVALLEKAQKTEQLNPGVRLRVVDKGPIEDDE